LRNSIDITMHDRFGQVKDAAVDIPGKPIMEKLRLRANPLQWSLAKPLRPSKITIGFEAVEPLPDKIVAPIQQISEILITLPAGFQHLVSELSDFTLVNVEMPLKDGDWLDYMQKDRLRIQMNLNQTSWQTLKVGTYSFRFDVMVPDPLPNFNVWHIALCGPAPGSGETFPGGCNKITDPAVLIAYAIPGFNLGEAAVATGAAASSAFVGKAMSLVLLALHIVTQCIGSY
jgi:hypothetical protein